MQLMTYNTAAELAGVSGTEMLAAAILGSSDYLRIQACVFLFSLGEFIRHQHRSVHRLQLQEKQNLKIRSGGNCKSSPARPESGKS